ncbi:MAG: hypothetical protein Q9205_000884 [Flavoplaca limonia]
MDPISPIAGESPAEFEWSSDSQNFNIDGYDLGIAIRISAANERRSSETPSTEDIASSPSDWQPHESSSPSPSSLGDETDNADSDRMSVSSGAEPGARSPSNGVNAGPDHMSLSSSPYGPTSPAQSLAELGSGIHFHAVNTPSDHTTLSVAGQASRSPSHGVNIKPDHMSLSSRSYGPTSPTLSLTDHGSVLSEPWERTPSTLLGRESEFDEEQTLWAQIEEIDSRQGIIASMDYDITHRVESVPNVEGRRTMLWEEWDALEDMKRRREGELVRLHRLSGNAQPPRENLALQPVPIENFTPGSPTPTAHDMGSDRKRKREMDQEEYSEIADVDDQATSSSVEQAQEEAQRRPRYNLRPSPRKRARKD